jgi:hypothetical protein
MARSLIERKLHEVGARLKALREELIVLDEQLAVFNDTASEARVRALVSETPLADREQYEASRHADAMTRSRADVVNRLAELERRQDELLDRLVAETG